MANIHTLQQIRTSTGRQSGSTSASSTMTTSVRPHAPGPRSLDPRAADLQLNSASQVSALLGTTHRRGQAIATGTRPVNIMVDPRVHRGTTYATTAAETAEALATQRQNEVKQRAAAHRKIQESLRPRTPPPVAGRMNMEIQTDLYLEELTYNVPEATVETQTDAFYDRPLSPLFVPKKSGEDVDTQIEAGELFDFDYEIQPILEVLVGKTLEQALMEVMEEAELARLRAHQKAFENKRNAELTEMQRLEDAERRRTEEKERRLIEAERLLNEQKEMAAKVAARAFTQSYLASLIPTVVAGLQESGLIHDPARRDIELNFMPWLNQQADTRVQQEATAGKVIDNLIVSALRNRAEETPLES